MRKGSTRAGVYWDVFAYMKEHGSLTVAELVRAHPHLKRRSIESAITYGRERGFIKLPALRAFPLKYTFVDFVDEGNRPPPPAECALQSAWRGIDPTAAV
jgi:hypothetical protein